MRPGFKTSEGSTHSQAVPQAARSLDELEMTTARRAPEVDFNQLFQEHAPYVWRALRRLGVREADCEDLLQEVFLTVHKRLPEFEGRSLLRTWVYGICMRKALDYRRLARIVREVHEDQAGTRMSEPNQEQTLEARRARVLLDGILDTLDDDKRAVFVLFEWEGLSMAEIAELMAVPVQTAYARLYAARRQVRDALPPREQP